MEAKTISLLTQSLQTLSLQHNNNNKSSGSAPSFNSRMAGKNKRRGRKNPLGKRKKRKRTKRRQIGGGIGLGAVMAIGRRALPIVARAGARVMMHAAKRLPRHLTKAAAQALIESEMKKQIAERRKNRYGFLGSIRWAATEKFLEDRDWAIKQRVAARKYHDRKALERKKMRAKRNKVKTTGPAPQWKMRIQQAKARQRRQVHMDAAIKRARSRRGLPPLT
jgi:hypothetical protein